MSLDSARHFDLHLHSVRSDGRLEPEAVLEGCAARGIDAVALTDHDLVVPLDPGPRRFGDRTVDVIAAAEVSGRHDRRELHLLVYFPGAAPTAFVDFCTEQSRMRAVRYDAAVRALGFSGLPGSDERARLGERAMTRLHLARDLVDHGHCRSVSEAFTRWLGDAHPVVPPIEIPFVDVIKFARSLGGVTSWAHPGLGQAQSYVETFVKAGLQGLELDRPGLSSSERKGLKKVAKRHGLFTTGGSDWHGWEGTEVGLFRVPRYDLRGFLDALGV